MIHEYEIMGLPLRTGDLVCTTDGGKRPFLSGNLWKVVGLLIPGKIDHIAIYVGPKGRCIEAGARGIIEFEARQDWDGAKMLGTRGFVDTFIGAAYPLGGKGLSSKKEKDIRESVAKYALSQRGKSYNFKFLNSKTEEAFYCSHLAYKAYLRHGIDLNTGKRLFYIPGTESIIFPQEIWDGNKNKRKIGD